MVRSLARMIPLALAAALALLLASSVGALTLLAPTEGQAVREMVRIEVPSSTVTENGFISVQVGEPGAQRFCAALSRSSAKEVGGKLVFFWNSKSPYYDPAQPKKELHFKDGRYPLMVQVHDGEGVTQDSATVNIVLKNKVARTNPSPAVSLVNKLSFGQVNIYRVHAEAEVFDQVNLPILGGMGLSGDARIIQSVEDVRPDGNVLLRCRVDDGAFVSAHGVKQMLYEGEAIKPQLYRLVTKRGKVISSNMFKKQAKFTIGDVLPVLPSTGVREGDSWPDRFSVKIEGITNQIRLEGSSMLESFEWQDGRECAKIESQLTGASTVVLANGKIVSTGPINAGVTTYFAYKTGAMLRREVRLEFSASIHPGAGDFQGPTNSSGASPSPSPSGPMSPYPALMIPEDEGGEPYPTGPRPDMGGPSGRPGSTSAADSGIKKGSVRINVVLRREK